jgi:hypothetical protein
MGTNTTTAFESKSVASERDESIHLGKWQVRAQNCVSNRRWRGSSAARGANISVRLDEEVVCTFSGEIIDM